MNAKRNTILVVLIVLTVTTFFVEFILKSQLLSGDVLDYWNDSLHLDTPFHPFHVPFYPFLVFLTRGVLGSIISPIWIMRIVTFSSLIISVYYAFKIWEKNEDAILTTSRKTILFATWPLVAITYTYFPVADSVVIAMIVAGYYYLTKEKLYLSFFLFGLALVTHKASWPMLALGLCGWWFFLYRKLDTRIVISGIILLIPISLLYTAGVIHYNSPTWIIDTNLQHEFQSKQLDKLPLFDGVYHELVREGGVTGILKGGLVILVLLFSCYTAYTSFTKKYTNESFWLGFSLGLILFVAILNYKEIWATVRFSRLLVLPLFLSVHLWYEFLTKMLKNNIVYVLLVIAFVVSNLGYTYYMVNYLDAFAKGLIK